MARKKVTEGEGLEPTNAPGKGEDGSLEGLDSITTLPKTDPSDESMDLKPEARLPDPFIPPPSVTATPPTLETETVTPPASDRPLRSTPSLPEEVLAISGLPANLTYRRDASVRDEDPAVFLEVGMMVKLNGVWTPMVYPVNGSLEKAQAVVDEKIVPFLLEKFKV